MRKFFQFFIVVLLAACPVAVPIAMAQSGEKPSGKNQINKQSMVPNQLVPRSRVSISNKRAASLVKRQYGSSRILGVSLMNPKGSPVYRVRTLSPKGVVKSVFVDGTSGEVFE